MANNGVMHANQLSYHKMCRWYSGFFFRHPALDKYKYYWRVEPNVKYVTLQSGLIPLPRLNLFVAQQVFLRH